MLNIGQSCDRMHEAKDSGPLIVIESGEICNPFEKLYPV